MRSIPSLSTGVAAIGHLRPWQLLLLITAVITAFYWPVFTAEFGITDDHEIMAFLSGGRLSLADVWLRLIADTEAGRPFDSGRYRPAYYLLRLVETWAWAETVTLWYIARLLIFIYLAYEAIRLVQRLMGPGYAITFFLTMLFSRVFVDTFGRLGPSEAYAALGCALCLTAARRISAKNFGAAEGLLVALGTFIAVGSKENFVFLLLPLAMVLVALNRPPHMPARAFALVSFAASLAIWSAVLPGTFGRGATIYADELPTLALLNSHPVATSLAIAAIAGVVLIVAAKLILSNRWLARLDDKNRETLMWAGLFVAAIVLQLLVYREFFTKNRYGFPAIPMLVFLALLVVSRLHAMLRDRQWPDAVRRWAPVAAAALVIGATIVPETKAWTRLNNWVGDTHKFQERYSALRDALRAKPDAGVALIVHSSRAYEPVASVRRYLVKDFGAIKIAVSVEDNTEYTDRQRNKLIGVLKKRQRDGGPGWQPLDELDQSNCIAAAFYGEKTRLPCPVVTQPWPVR